MIIILLQIFLITRIDTRDQNVMRSLEIKGLLDLGEWCCFEVQEDNSYNQEGRGFLYSVLLDMEILGEDRVEKIPIWRFMMHHG